MRTLTFAFPAIERLVYDKPAPDTLRVESERLGDAASCAALQPQRQRGPVSGWSRKRWGVRAKKRRT